jgi:hypothetical protein
MDFFFQVESHDSGTESDGEDLETEDDFHERDIELSEYCMISLKK